MQKQNNKLSRYTKIKQILNSNFECLHLEVIDESSQHSLGKGSESHFKIVLASDSFKNLDRVERHRRVNQCLQSQWLTNLHALSLKLYTSKEWAEMDHQILKSPPCHKNQTNNF